MCSMKIIKIQHVLLPFCADLLFTVFTGKKKHCDEILAIYLLLDLQKRAAFTRKLGWKHSLDYCSGWSSLHHKGGIVSSFTFPSFLLILLSSLPLFSFPLWSLDVLHVISRVESNVAIF